MGKVKQQKRWGIIIGLISILAAEIGSIIMQWRWGEPPSNVYILIGAVFLVLVGMGGTKLLFDEVNKRVFLGPKAIKWLVCMVGVMPITYIVTLASPETNFWILGASLCAKLVMRTAMAMVIATFVVGFFTKSRRP